MAQSDEKGWRELCAAAAKETDSEKLSSLVHQILRAFDQEDRQGEADAAAVVIGDAGSEFSQPPSRP